MRKAIAALAFATLGTGAAVALGGTAGAATPPSTDATQHQSATNTNTTDQQSSTLISIPQINLNLPISVLSPDAATGDVDQSNVADVTASSGNESSSDQAIDQVQTGEASSSVDSTVDRTVDGHGTRHGGDAIGDATVTGGDATLGQGQSATNDNETTQDSTTKMDVPQTNLNLPISVLSPGAATGDVDQANTATVDATSGNTNTSDQSVVQDQSGTATSTVDSDITESVEGGHGNGWDKGSDKGQGHGSIGDTTVTGGDATLDQGQTGTNSNVTDQDSTTTVDVPQSNTHEAHTTVRDDRGHKGHGRNDGGWMRGGDETGDQVVTGDVTQGNDADVDATSGNSNESVQGVTQDQSGEATSTVDSDVDATVVDTEDSGDRDHGKGWNHGHGRDRDHRDHGKGWNHGHGWDRDHGSIGDTTVTGGDATLDQDQTGTNSNVTDQDSTTTVDVPQSNTNEAHTTVRDDRGHKGHGWNDCGHKGHGWNHGWAWSPTEVTTGDVEQSNDADVTASSGNSNDSVQDVDQDQEGAASSRTFSTFLAALMG